MFKFGSKINLASTNGLGFDSFTAAKNCFVLCDGANSCVNGGILAHKLSKSVALSWSSKKKNISDRRSLLLSLILSEHKKYLAQNLNAASTLVALGILNNEFEIFSVGDSYAEVFYKDKLSKWKKIRSIPRDIDLHGNPWQLVGSEVFERVNYINFNDSGTYCIFLLSDGAGNFLQKNNFLRVLNLVGDKEPDSYDLDYLSSDLASEARINGSDDDISVVILFITQ